MKERTEAFWRKDPNAEEDFPCPEWAHGAKWVGLQEAEIDEVEKKYGVTFTPDHREFLKVLHCVDRKEAIVYTDSDEEDAEEHRYEHPFFYNWLTDEQEIREKLNWSYRTILEDVEGQNVVWLKSWGERPDSPEEREAVFADWYRKTPKLLPIHIHRFVVSEPVQRGNPVLSVWGSDIIVYGWNLRSYLLQELQTELGLLDLVFNEEDQQWYTEEKKELRDIVQPEYAAAVDKRIPYWEEVILYWSSGWWTMGRKYPYPADGPSPIVKAIDPDGGEQAEGDQFKYFEDH
ncbi:MAG TPA: hypothetical protein VF646_09530 [Cytophagales bacterium]